MNKLQVLLVDDEYLALQLLESFVNKLPNLEIVGKIKSPIQAMDILNKEEIDILFLDIQMPTLSGTNLLKTLKRKPITIFTTAYSEYALDAFDLDAIDYLLKPFSFERFLQAVNKAKEQLKSRKNIIVSEEVSEEKTEEYFAVKSDAKIVKVFFNDILYIEGLKEYVRIICENEKIVTLERLKNMEVLLPSKKFLRVHKSYIINISKVKSVEGNRLQLGKHLIPISRGKKDMVMERIF